MSKVHLRYDWKLVITLFVSDNVEKDVVVFFNVFVVLRSTKNKPTYFFKHSL